MTLNKRFLQKYLKYKLISYKEYILFKRTYPKVF